MKGFNLVNLEETIKIPKRYLHGIEKGNLTQNLESLMFEHLLNYTKMEWGWIPRNCRWKLNRIYIFRSTQRSLSQ